MEAAYFHGVRLFEAVQEMPGWASRTGEKDFEGVRQRNKKANDGSPNFERPVRVRCYVEERAFDAVSGYATNTAIENTLLDVEDRLRDVAMATGQGPLSYTEDSRRRATIGAGASAGAGVVVTIGTPAGGWTPAVGHLVLFRNRTTNAGFTSEITAVGVGTITCTLTSAITTSWEVLRVDRIFVSAVYETMDGGSPRDENDPRLDRKDVSYSFSVYGDPLMPSASLLTGYTE